MIRIMGALTLLLTCLMTASLAYGDVSLSWLDLYHVLSGSDRAVLQSQIIVWDLRLPRILLALLVGVALATAGTISLALMRNPLAEPGVLGINSGAAAAAMAVIVLVNDPPVALLQVAGFLGASCMALAVFALSWRSGSGTSSLRIILIGIGLSALASAGTTFLSAFGDIGDVQRAMIWLAGSVYDANMGKVRMLALWLIIPVAFSFLAARELDLIRFGNDTARSLGQPVERMRGLLILLVTVLSGAAIAVSGLIGFVGLVAPHIAYRLAGTSHARILPVAALVGACLLVGSDLIGRIILPPAQLPAGIVTGLIGAPFFAYLLWRRRHGR